MTIPSHAVVAGLLFTAPLVAVGAPWWIAVPVALWYGVDASCPDMFTWIEYRQGEGGRWDHRPYYHDIRVWTKMMWYRPWRWGYLSHIYVDPIFHGDFLPQKDGWQWVWAQREFMVVLTAVIIHVQAWGV
jgi:hypothetical protein